MRLSFFRAMCVVLCALALSSCAAGNYLQPIQKFRTATDDAKTSLDAELKAVDNTILDYSLSLAAADNDSKIVTVGGDCLTDSARCRLTLVAKDGDWPFSRGALGQNVSDLMAAVATYSATLESIASATTAADIQKGLNDAKANAISLAGTIETIPGATPGLKDRVTAYAGPITELVGFGLRQYTESVKIAALRTAVGAMDIDLDAMVFVFDEASKAAANSNLEVLSQALIKAHLDLLDKPHDKKTLEALRTAAENLDTALIGRPIAMFVALRQAHAALNDALQGRFRSFEAVYPHLQTVIDEAQKFAHAAKQLEEAATKKGGKSS